MITSTTYLPTPTALRGKYCKQQSWDYCDDTPCEILALIRCSTHKVCFTKFCSECLIMCKTICVILLNVVLLDNKKYDSRTRHGSRGLIGFLRDLVKVCSTLLNANRIQIVHDTAQCQPLTCHNQLQD